MGHGTGSHGFDGGPKYVQEQLENGNQTYTNLDTGETTVLTPADAGFDPELTDKSIGLSIFDAINSDPQLKMLLEVMGGTVGVLLSVLMLKKLF